MTGIDIVLGAFLAYGLVKGIWKGLFAELASLIALLAGIFIAVRLSMVVGGAISEEPSRTTSIIAFVITFTIVIVAITLLAKVFTRLADFAGLGLFNRLLGGLFGLLKMIMILSVLLNFFIKINSSNAFAEEKTLNDSMFFYPVLSVSNYIFPSLEEWFTNYKEEATETATEPG